MLDFNYKKECYSCRSCEYACPKKAIKSNNKTNTFFPKINDLLCVSCQKCDNICPALNISEKQDISNSKAFIAINNNNEERLKSSSGGIFILLAKQYLKEGNYVCGCIYDENNMPKHIVSDRIEDIYKMMGSKYVQSDLSECYGKIATLLKEGKKILFSGVACQIVAVNNTFKNKNIFYVGITCHGIISRDLWKLYLDLEEEKYGGKVISCNMRGKAKGWKNYGLIIRFDDGSEHITYRYDDGYLLKCYTLGLLQQDRCLNCEYKITNTSADIFLGDGWGIENIYPQLDDNNGVSSIIVLTKTGTKMIFQISKNLKLVEFPLETALSLNPRLTSPSPKNKEIYNVRKKIKNNPRDLNKILKQYSKDGFVSRVKKKLRKYFQ